jgi:hypothetical protein
MSSPAGRPRTARALRGGIVATVATAVALGSHVAGGGDVPGLLGVLAPWAVSLWLCTLVSRRPAPWRTLVAVTASQTLFHTLFVLGTPTGASSAGGGAHAHHAQHTMPAPSGTTLTALQADTTMWAWHAAAAAATAAMLFHGEALLHHLRHLAGLVVSWLLPRRDLVPFGTPRTVRPAVVATGHRPARHGPELSLLRRRGPPALTV